jgi:quinol monooxygenase YgiN
MQFARTVHFRIKDGKKDEFNRLFEKEVLPVLRNQDGFLDEVTLVSPERCMGISLWNDDRSASTYHESAYPKVLERLDPFIEGTPKVETYEVALNTVSA